MMRSLFSGVAGLRTHQTRMDVIGNNIANVNTTAYKSQSMVFSDLLYQTTQAASGANAATGRGGINARQIGLGAKTGAISTAITAQGSAQSTNNPFDIMITGEQFFIVNNGQENFFTRDGSFTIDGAGNLVMSSTGYKVMGWQVDKETGNILPDTVSALQVMSAENLTYPPEATSKAYVNGIVDMYDTALSSTAGRIITLKFFDNRGYSYTGKFSIHSLGTDGQYYVALDDILDEKGDSLVKKYNLSSISEIASFGSTSSIETTIQYKLLDTADYDDDTGTYSMKYYPENVLDGYSTNRIINASSPKPTIIAIDGAAIADGATEMKAADGKSVKKATVSGKVELSKSDLVELGIIYDDDTNQYYYNKTTTTGGTGGGTTTTTTARTALRNSGDNTGWQDALADYAKGISVSKIEVDSDGIVTMEYTQVIDIISDKTVTSYDVKEGYFIGDNITDELEAYGLSNTDTEKYTIELVAPDGKALIKKTTTYTGNRLTFDVDDGSFVSIGGSDSDSATLSFNSSATSRLGEFIDLSFFRDVDIDFSNVSNVANGGKTTAEMTSGDGSENNLGSGRRVGEMIGIEVGQDGKITASYDNGQSKILGQIAVASFANASGLAKQGDNLYSATMNSGEFDGVGSDITAEGGKMESGVLEMSNVDLSSEFTEMITTQRGFQANSRIISVSDGMLEELVNLKR